MEPDAEQPWVRRLVGLQARARLDDLAVSLLRHLCTPELAGVDGASTAVELLRSTGTAPELLQTLLGPGSALVSTGLVQVPDAVPLARAEVRPAPRVLRWLAGDDGLHADLQPLSLRVPLLTCGTSRRIASALEVADRVVVVRERPGGLASAAAAAAMEQAGWGCLALDLSLALPGEDLEQAVAHALLDALLLGLGLVLSPYDALVQDAPRGLRLLAEPMTPVVLTGSAHWGPTLVRVPPVQLVAEDWTGQQRAALWLDVLGDGREAGALPGDLVAQELRPVQVVRAVERAALEGSTSADALLAAAREESTGALTRLARAIEPVASWDDLVLPALPRRQLQQVVERVRSKEIVRGWAVGGRSATRRGTVALFGGPPGTGKTLAVEVIARTWA